MKSCWHRLFPFCIAFGLVSGLSGQGTQFSQKVYWENSVSLRGTEGEVGRQGGETRIQHLQPLTRIGQFATAYASVGYGRYRISGVEEASPLASIKGYREASVGFFYSDVINRTLGWGAGGSLRSATEDGASRGGSVAPAAFAAVRWSINPDLTLSAGARYQSRLVKSDVVLPLLRLEWQIDPRWRMELSNRLSLRGQVDDKGTLFTTVALDFDRTEYRLRRENPLPRGVLEDRRLRAGIELEKFFPQGPYVRAGVGLGLSQQIRLQDREGNTINRNRFSRPAVFSFEGGYRF